MSSFASGAALFIGIVFVAAGGLKLLLPWPFQHAVYRLIPETWPHRRTLAQVAAPLVGCFEVLVGAGLMATPWLGRGPFAVVACLTVAACLCFAGIVRYTINAGTACGCFSSFSDGPAGPVELGRSLFLAALSVAVLTVVLTAAPLTSWRWAVAGWASASAVLLVLFLAVITRVSSRVSRRDASLGAIATAPATAPATPPITRLRTLTAFLSFAGGGGVAPRTGDSPLPFERALSTTETQLLTSIALRSPALVAFAGWLGPRATEIDWSTAVAETTTGIDSDGRATTMTNITPTTPASMHVEVFMPGGAESGKGVAEVAGTATLLIAVVDGIKVVASGRGVQAGTEPGHDSGRQMPSVN